MPTLSMGRPTAHNRPIHSRDGLYRGPPRPMTPARKKYQRLFSTPLRSWLRTVAQAAPATPPCRGAHRPQSVRPQEAAHQHGIHKAVKLLKYRAEHQGEGEEK